LGSILDVFVRRDNFWEGGDIFVNIFLCWDL
jgi:hypothetical protein